MNSALSRRWFQIVLVSVLMYTISFVDRMNVAVALPSMKHSLHLSSAAAGMAAGAFFIGYFVLQIPAGTWAVKFGSKRLVGVLLVLWGILAMASGLVQNSTELYVVRFALGLAEGGIWPATLVLLGNWFLQEERARANALWMVCLPLGGAVMGPLSGVLIAHFNWRWMFVLEGIPALLLLIPWLLLIDDKPSQAKWMPRETGTHLEQQLEDEQARKKFGMRGHSWITRPNVIVLALVYILSITGGYGILLWIPSIVKKMSGAGIQQVGIVSAVPYVFAIVAMLWFGALADKTQKHAKVVAISLVIASVAMFLSSFTGVHNWILTIILLSIAVAGFFGRQGPLWAIPTKVLTKEEAAPAMGFINAFGNLGGFIGPVIFGAFLGRTHNYVTGYLALALALVIAAGLMMWVKEPRRKDGLSVENYPA